ncbi:MAG: hypothetical protein KAH04_03110 [Psychrilyobacter sp.]|nr:hypothetical protein [Psychrilyobacter sp.]
MNDLYIQKEKAKEDYEKFTGKGKILGIPIARTEELKKFSETQIELAAYNNSNLGIQDVPISKIIGSVQKIDDFKKGFVPRNKIVKTRWCNIYTAMLGDGSLPPVILYKIREEYYVYDGNHRISVANYLNYLSIEAEVIEYFSGDNDKEEIKYRKKFEFMKQTNLDIELTHSDDYKKILLDISDYTRGQITLEQAKKWNLDIYQPIIEILKFNELIGEDELEGDIYRKFISHRNYLKQAAKIEDYSYGIIDYMNMRYIKQKQTLESQIKVDNRINRVIEKLYKLDKERLLEESEKEKLREIRTYIRGDFLDEYYFLLKNKGNIEEWYNNSIENTLSIFREKTEFRGESKIIAGDELKLYREIDEYLTYYKIGNKKSSEKEGILDYILEVFLPTTEYLNLKNLEDSDYLEGYYNFSHRKVKFLKSGKKISFIELETLYPDIIKEATTIKEWLYKTGEKEKKYKGDILKSVREILLIKGQSVEEFNELMDLYGGTTNYETILKIKENIWETVGNNPSEDWTGNILSKSLDELINDLEALKLFKTERFMNFIKKKSDTYTLIDFLYRKKKSIVV